MPSLASHWPSQAADEVNNELGGAGCMHGMKHFQLGLQSLVTCGALDFHVVVMCLQPKCMSTESMMNSSHMIELAPRTRVGAVYLWLKQLARLLVYCRRHWCGYVT
jgi:hypothetical protein